LNALQYRQARLPSTNRPARISRVLVRLLAIWRLPECRIARHGSAPRDVDARSAWVDHPPCDFGGDALSYMGFHSLHRHGSRRLCRDGARQLDVRLRRARHEGGRFGDDLRARCDPFRRPPQRNRCRGVLHKTGRSGETDVNADRVLKLQARLRYAGFRIDLNDKIPAWLALAGLFIG
jgi:hypothetical protein